MAQDQYLAHKPIPSEDSEPICLSTSTINKWPTESGQEIVHGHELGPRTQPHPPQNISSWDFVYQIFGRIGETCPNPPSSVAAEDSLWLLSLGCFIAGTSHARLTRRKACDLIYAFFSMFVQSLYLTLRKPSTALRFSMLNIP